MGIGKFMINSAMKIWPHASSKIKIENKASLKLFDRAASSKNIILWNRK